MILDYLNDLNWAAVGTALAAAFTIAMVWFAPAVLGTAWAHQVERYTGAAQAEIEAAAGRPAPLGKWLAGFAVASVAMALVAEASGTASAGEGVVLGLVLAAGLGATFSSWPPVFARMPWTWWLINNGAFALALAAMGAILGAWQ